MLTQFHSLFWPPFLVSLGASFFLTLLTFFLSWRTKLIGIDDPRLHHHPKVVHRYPVPRGGGLPIFFSLLLVVLLFLPLDKKVRGIMLGALLTLVVGLIDDRFDISPYWRLLANLGAALCVVGAGVGIGFITNPLGGIIHLDQPRLVFSLGGVPHQIWLLSSLFGVLWIVWNMNIVGWSCGVDGQLPGFVVIASLVIAILGLRFRQDMTQWPVIILAAGLAGAYLGFLPWNFYPQKIMPGYSGKSLAGYFLAVLSILSGAKVATMILVLGVPMADAVIAIGRRVSQGHSPVWGDRGHLHHKLLDLGFSKRQIAAFYWLFSAILGAGALFLNSTQKFYAIIMVFFSLLAFSFWFKNFFNHHSSGS